MNREEVRIATLKYFKGDEMATDAWINKYCIKDGDNYLELTPEDMHKRMINEFERIYSEVGDDKLNTRQIENLSILGKWLYSNNNLKKYIGRSLHNFKYIVPQGSIMSQLGNNVKIGSLSNCFVVGQPHDSYGGIIEKDEQLAQLMKRRGGVGLDISTLRPATTNVNNTAGTSTGAVSFMERFSNTTREVAQDGRRGALMLTIDCRHPDVLAFINSKKDRTKVTGANISVMLRNDFMEAVKKDEDYILRFPCDIPLQGDEIENYKLSYNELFQIDTNKHIKRVKAKEIYDSIVENAWENAEPGQMFVDKHWNYSPDTVYPRYKGITTNPCGEIFMGMYDACRLLALNLVSFVRNNKTLDYENLYKYAYIQQVLADYIVELEVEKIIRILDKISNDPEPDEVKQTEFDLWLNILEITRDSRRTGSGFTGLGDMLALMNLKYDSPEAKQTIDHVMRIKMEAELDATIDRAILHGPFEEFDKNKEFISKLDNHGKINYGTNEFFEFILNQFPEQANKMFKYGRRNVSWSTVAPTGTVSLLTQTTSGLEPLFMPFYMRRRKVNPSDKDARIDFIDQNGDSWQEYAVIHPNFIKWIETTNDYKELSTLDWCNKVEDLNKATLESLFKQSPWYGSTANDIDWKARVEIQSIIQKYTSHSISSTINLPNTVTKEEVSEIYIHSFNKGLKGVTVYRDGSRTGVLVSNDDKNSSTFQYKDAVKRPVDLPCKIHNVRAKGKDWTVLIGFLDDKPYEVFAFPQNGLNKKAEEGILHKVGRKHYNLLLVDGTIYEKVSDKMNDEEEVITRLISTALRHGADIKFILAQLNKSNGTIVSFSKAIARTLIKYITEEDLIKMKLDDCPDDGQECNIIFEEGCSKCTTHGTSKCS